MFDLQANIIPHEARCFSLELGHCQVNLCKLCKADRSQDSMLTLLLDPFNISILHQHTWLVRIIELNRTSGGEFCSSQL